MSKTLLEVLENNPIYLQKISMALRQFYLFKYEDPATNEKKNPAVVKSKEIE